MYAIFASHMILKDLKIYIFCKRVSYFPYDFTVVSFCFVSVTF